MSKKSVDIHPVVQCLKHPVYRDSDVDSWFIRLLDWVQSHPDRILDLNLILFGLVCVAIGFIVGFACFEIALLGV